MRGSDLGQTSAPDVRLDEADVAAYLAAHPDFFDRHADLLDQLAGRAVEDDDRIVDLRSFMVARLRGETDRLRDKQRALISASRANQNSRNRIHAAVLFLLDAGNFEQLIQTVTTDLAVLLDIDVAVLLVESTGPDLPPMLASGVRVVGEGIITNGLQGKSVLLEGDIDGDERIYGGAAGLVHSQVLLRLDVSPDTPPCMLAMGSREPDMFHAGMRTDLVCFLGHVLERCIRGWLDLPPS